MHFFGLPSNEEPINSGFNAIGWLSFFDVNAYMPTTTTMTILYPNTPVDKNTLTEGWIYIHYCITPVESTVLMGPLYVYSDFIISHR